MAIKKIVKIWEDGKVIEKNIKFLKKATKKVRFPLTDNMHQIIKDLIDTYKTISCAGIAANQIGYEHQIFIGMKDMIEEPKDIEAAEADQTNQKGNSHPENYEILINPQIDKTDDKSVNTEEEGCLSIPRVYAIRERFDKIKVRYYNLEGRAKKQPRKGFLSKLFQHELDHLNGKLMIDPDEKLENIIPNQEVENTELNELSLLLKEYYKEIK